MSLDLLDLVGDSKMATKKENKKKLHKLWDKYGSVEEIEKSGDLKDGFELDFVCVSGSFEKVFISISLVCHSKESTKQHLS